MAEEYERIPLSSEERDARLRLEWLVEHGHIAPPLSDEPPTREELDEVARRNTESIARYAAEITAEAVKKLREERGQR